LLNGAYIKIQNLAGTKVRKCNLQLITVAILLEIDVMYFENKISISNKWNYTYCTE
jgi:hypothetical protein